MKLTINGYQNKLENKYYKWYCDIITNKILNPITEGYTENHHIIPTSLGGDNNQSNLVRLSAREHFIVHSLLPKFITGQGKYSMIRAHMFTGKKSDPKYKYSKSKIYENLRIEYSDYMKTQPSPWSNTEIHKKCMETRVKNGSNIFITNNPMHNEETKRKKMSSMPIMKGRKCWFNTLTNQRRQCVVMPDGDGWIRQGHSKGLTTKAKGVAKPKVICPSCGEGFAPHTLQRHINARHSAQ
tara:strand:+ start:209 stop:928 length:720 start_codon:yes stop_codon:yes gene_type:complete